MRNQDCGLQSRGINYLTPHAAHLMPNLHPPMQQRFLLALFAFTPCALASSHLKPVEPLSQAVRQLYNSDFTGSRRSLSAFVADHPDDPLPHSLIAATYFFADLERTGALEKNVLSDDRARSSADNVTPETSATGPAFDPEVNAARKQAENVLRRDPENRNALLAMLIASGLQRDYLALVQHRYRESYTYMKESQSYAARLLKADPSAYDAYFTRGFTEYLIGSMPAVLRWFMKMNDLVCTRQQGLQDLQVAADRGTYMRPFAQMMLAMFYLRERDSAKTEELLTRLSRDFPENPTFRRELDRLRSQTGND